MDQRKMNLGILLDSYYIPAWLYHSIEGIVNSSCADFSLIILNESANTKKKRGAIVYEIFNSIDERLFVRGQSATQVENVGKLLNRATVIKVNPLKKGNADYFEKTDIDNIRGCGLDILVKIGFDDLRGDILTASKYGVWEYLLGNPHGFREVMEGPAATGVDLRILDEGNNGSRTIFRSSSSTYPFSPARNRNRSLWKSSSFLPRQIALLYSLGEEEFFKGVEKYSTGNSPSHQEGNEMPPSNLLYLGLIARLLIIIAREIFSRLFFLDAWFLMFDLDTKLSVPLEKYKKMIPPKDRFWADPHILQKDDRYYVFIEEYDHKVKKGHISVLEMDQSGKYSAPVRILEKEYHLSYPNVFEWKGRYYMVPESAANQTIDLYECMEFPNKWEYRMSLMENIKAVDSTLCFYHDRWWLFTGISENEGSFPEVELFLFYTDDLFGGHWEPHRMNPIISDAKNARPAGRIFSRDGKLFRPSQDCSRSYGYGFNLNEILVLSESEYIEESVFSVRPDWDKKVLGTHTYGAEGNLKIIDAYTTRQKFLN